MRQTLINSALLLLAAGTCATPGWAQVSYFQDQVKVIRAPNAASALGTSLFGDSINLYNGGLEFVHTDVSLPGSNSLPVMISRRLIAGSEVNNLMQFGNWDLEIPHLHGTYTSAQGWAIPYPPAGSSAGSRCSQFGPPPAVPGAGAGLPSNFTPDEYWHGHFLYIPGHGDQELLRRDAAYANVPKDGQTYPVVTQRLWALRCLPAIANGTELGEGFVAVSPDGTTYRFDWLATRNVQALTKPGGTSLSMTPASAVTAIDTTGGIKIPTENSFTSGLLARSEVWIMPSTVTDRFGNTVSYTYNPAMPWQLLQIHASDGRTITLQYVPGTNQISSVYDGTRTWTYSYIDGVLDTVTLPDASTWQLAAARNLQQKFEINSNCDSSDVVNDPDLPSTATLVHPSGAAGTFTLTPTTHGRSWVPRSCRGSVASGTSYAYRPRYFSSLSLTHKSISGPGLQNMDWEYSYGAPNASWSPCDGCAETNSTVVTDPKGNTTTYTFGNRYELTEGQLQKVEVSDAHHGLLRTTTTRYHAANAGPYAPVIGWSGQHRGDGGMGQTFRPQDQQIISQQDATFTWQATAFDTKARATAVTKSNSLGFSRSETTTFADNRPSWTPYVLGLVETVTDGSGNIMASNTYHSTTATLLTSSKFGHLEQTLSYNSDGTLATHKDGKNNITKYSSYSRGIPQLVTYADATVERATVNNIGKITALSNATGATTRFEYDAMGRLAKITYPSPDTVAWHPTTVAFSVSNSSRYGLPAGHWRQVVKNGNAVTTTYYDALWREVISEQSDSTNEAATARVVEHQYDHEGHTTFQSYPQRSYGQISAGVHTQYDALGRTETVSADSELGPLNTTHAYQSGFTTSVTDPRGHVTTMAFQAFDQPSEEAIISIAAPESVSVNIARDAFGKTLSVTRSGLGKSVTRSYVYDANQRLCKTIEPETGATVQDYDLANNVAWRATGLGLPSTTSCDNTAIAAPATKRTVFGYDMRNRLTSTTYGDGSPAISRSYKSDGLPATVTSNGAVWTLSYNARRLPTTQVLSFGGQNYTLGTVYDANGNISALNYPTENNPLSMKSVAYNPDALGEPSQVGSFARAISYWPSGAVAGFTYGNGKAHSMSQNLRNLPELASDAGIVQDHYSYDQNGNVTSITDQLAGTGNRSMAYDGLDRLIRTGAPGMWGAASYTYDALDNITSSNVGNRAAIHNYDAANRLANVQSSVPGYSFFYGYDSQGNVTSRGAQVFTFDQGNRLTSAANKDSYVYDGFGHRVRTTAVDGSVTTSIYSPAGQLLYTTVRGGPRPATTTAYVYLHQHQVAEVKR